MVGVLLGRNRCLRAMLNFAAKGGVRAKIQLLVNKLVDNYHKGVSGKLAVEDVLQPVKGLEPDSGIKRRTTLGLSIM
jgi:hypothetical protein